MGIKTETQMQQNSPYRKNQVINPPVEITQK